ncbi:MAG: ABC transporter permease [Alphaproteobacteria bacterium]|nr:ABC transporter permease [Alphaproteobacteria bacterium]MBO6861383.1 ABC transporter permease [Alphaproteobacteria bacterium]
MKARVPQLWIGGALTGVILLAAILSLFWTPYGIDQQSIADRLQGPSAGHWLGTDMFGRDILSRILGGAGTALTVGLAAIALGLAGGLPLGLAAAMNRDGPADMLIARGADLIFAFPALLSAVLIAAVHGPGAINVVVAVGIFNIAVFARVVRGAALSVMARPFLRAALAMGRPWPSVAVKHLLPNIAGVIAVQATIQFAVAILAEAGLSYLGLGVKPPNPSWGKMLADAQTLLYVDPRQAIFPGLAILWAVLGLNLLGDGLRDFLDPRLRKIRAI